MIRLMAVVEEEGKAPRAFTYEGSAKVTTIGRDSKNDFQVPVTSVSRQHARITFQDNTYLIEDLGSTHGSTLNGRKLNAGEKKVLNDGDVIEMTKARITVTIEHDNIVIADPGEKTQAIAAKAVEEILGRIGGDAPVNEGPFFRVLNGPDEGQRHILSATGHEWVLGRSKEAEFVLNDANVSRRHGLVRKDWNGITIEDLGSKNGVIVNDKKIKKKKLLKHRDEVRIGPIKLLFIDPDFELLNALEDFPGFEPEEEDDDDEDLEAQEALENSDPGAEIEPAGGETSDEGEPASAPEPMDDEDDLPPEIDESLLEPDHGGMLTTILLIVGGGLLLLLLAVVVLFLLL